MRIIKNKLLPPKGFAAINLFGFVFVRYGTQLSNQSKRHEAIHTQQMKYMLYVFFYVWYGFEWLIRLIQYRNAKTAYYNISFEREAYANDQQNDYLSTRKAYTWSNYIRMTKESS